MSGPALEFNIDNFKFKVIHNGTNITGFNITTGGLNKGDWGGDDFTVYAYYGSFDTNLSVTELIACGCSMGTQTLTGDTDASWENTTLDFSPIGNTNSQVLYLYFVVGTATDVGYIKYDTPPSGWSGITNNAYIDTSDVPSSAPGYIDFYNHKGAASFYEYLERSGSEYVVSGGSPLGINCLTKGTKILTPNGYVKVEDLKKGDIILNSKKEEKAIKEMLYQKARIIKGVNHLNEKFLLKKDSLGENLPSEDLIVSGGHMIKVGDDFHLPRNSDLFENIHEEVELVEYYNIELDDYDFIISHGVEIESLCRAENHKEKEKYFEERGIDYWKFVKPK